MKLPEAKLTIPLLMILLARASAHAGAHTYGAARLRRRGRGDTIYVMADGPRAGATFSNTNELFRPN